MGSPRRVLFLCTGNSCRSQMAEAMLRLVGGEAFESLSAGSHPAGFIHPLAFEVLQRLHVPVGDQQSKSWDEFTHKSIDAVITLCDAAAAEPCPTFGGEAMRAHWSTPDPAFHPGTVEERIEYAMLIGRRLMAKIEGLVRLDWSAERAAFEQQIRFLGDI